MAMDLKANPRSNRPLIIACVLAAVLQVALTPQVIVFGGQFNFMLALTVTAAIGADTRTMVYLGFFAGLFYDLTSLVPIGLMALLLTLLGYVVSAVSRGIVPGFSMGSLRLVCVGVVAVQLIYSVALYFMGLETSLLMSLAGHALSGSIMTIIACLPLLLICGMGNTPTFRPSSFSSGGMRFKGQR